MATTSTIVTVKTQLVTKFTTALATSSESSGQVQVAYAWPGPNTKSEAVFLGYHPQLRDIRLDANDEIPTIKAGRKQRQENYTVPVTCWVFRPDLTAADAETCETRAFAMFGDCEDVLADDPLLGLAQGTIQWAKLGDVTSTLWPFERGWSCELVFDVDVQARLT